MCTAAPAPQKKAPTIDVLTADLHATNLDGSSGPDFRAVSSKHLKQLLLEPVDETAAASIPGSISSQSIEAPKAIDQAANPSVIDVAEKEGDSASAPSAPQVQGLVKYIADRVTYEGGEFVLRIGAPSPNESDAETATFTDEELSIAIANVVKASSLSDADASVLHQQTAEDGHSRSAHVLIRRIPAGAEELVELRIAVIGNVDAGKSTMLGVLTKGGLDDGRGKARVNLFRHKHEIESGRTSSVGMEIMGFDSKGRPVHNAAGPGQEPGRKMSWEEVCAKSSKVISFIDLAGHERYLKTTVFGMTGCLPDFVMLMVGANAGLIGMSKEHLGIALALSVPVVVCITKIDMTPAHVLETTLKQLTKILKSPGCRKTPVFINDMGQVVESALRLETERICPIFQISNVTGLNLDLLRSFLNILPQASAAKFQVNQPFEFQISDIFSVPFVGTVVSGVVLGGSCKVGDVSLLGPDSLGQFVTTSIRSIQRKRVNVDGATAGQSVSFALKKIRRNQVRKGMVMVARTEVAPKSYMEFDAEILCLYHSTTLSVGSCMVLHAASIRQTVRIVGIAKLDGKPTLGTGAAGGDAHGGKPVVRTGDRAKLRLQFIRYPEYVKPGMKLITREGKTKLIGVVRAVGQTGPLGGAAAAMPNAGPSNVPPAAHNTNAYPAPALGVK
ncbi:Elongation factor, GTP-binding domain protein [Kalmanozyma brasiliensis GHG001]|uniref:GTP-binding protein GP-1 n=1 Tax=Kalmanozyma brasiliensis (strain GHG001) TaxID=1365824 RepID=V5EXP2_KALBG|nr:Elongation factor, GTP-binding domain protein [Kalmanozyma brasiliensis GHG001]EST08313.1 Elongation factor, GTP-binding domain protein [Kalmanozyma brasiliensis GHG001]